DKRGANGVTVTTNNSGSVEKVTTRDGQELFAGKAVGDAIISKIDVIDGKPQISYDNNTIERFNERGDRLITDGGGEGNLVKSISADGKTTIDFGYENGALSNITRTTLDHNKEPHETTFNRNQDGTWTDSNNNKYNALYVDQAGSTIMRNDTSWRQMDASGREVEETYKANSNWTSANRLSRLERDALGQVTKVTDSQNVTTVLGRNSQNELISVMQGSTGLIKNPDGSWKDPLNSTEVLKADLSVDSTGKLTMRQHGENPIVREVAADGTVTLTRPDQSQTIYSADGSKTTHLHAPDSSIKQVTSFRNGETQVVMKDGTTYSQNPNVGYNRVTVKGADGKISTINGNLNVNESGDLTLQVLSSNVTGNYDISSVATQKNGTVEATLANGNTLRQVGTTITEYDANGSPIMGTDGKPVTFEGSIIPGGNSGQPKIMAAETATVFNGDGTSSQFTRTSTPQGQVWANDTGIAVKNLSELGAADAGPANKNSAMEAGQSTSSLTRGTES
ncbi:MAG: hypothetical protein K8F91_02625, partial [Candidatus Obscuribacterales bacterium]|nr:hypothetical protein [Candidatus Obscuribacterales bacterium]